MRILFLSHYFPPEVNAPATRTFEHCREWVLEGHEVHVVTGFPSHPAGELYPGYTRTWYQPEELEGIQVHRTWTHIAANRGFLRRALNYLSFVPTSVWRALRLGRFDIILATSPHYFNAVAGWLASVLKRTPWVFELRDLWPESIVAVGALKPSWPLRVLDRHVRFLYGNAAAVVCLTRPFAEHVIARGIDPEKLVYVPNGVYPDDWPTHDPASSCREELGIEPDQILASYVGTLGMAHGLETLLDAAARLQTRRPEIRFLLAGDGAQKQQLVSAARRRGLRNVLFAGQLPRREAHRLLASSDISLVLLRDAPLFRTVLPSKMFEAMAAGRPIILGVAGEAQRVLEESGGGIAVPPEDPAAIAGAVSRLAADPALRQRLGASGRAFVQQSFHRRDCALRLLRILERCADSGSAGGAA